MRPDIPIAGRSPWKIKKARPKMFRSWKLGTAFGIGIYVHWTFLLLPAWVFLSNWGPGPAGVALYLVLLTVAVFGCILLHELGHALMARYFGIPTRDITLTPIGGIARLERMTDEPSQELLVALAGPAVNVVIALLLAPLVFVAMVGKLWVPPTEAARLLAASPAELLFTYFVSLFAANVGLVLFNMIPCFPMDGGRVFRALLSMVFGLM